MSERDKTPSTRGAEVMPGDTAQKESPKGKAVLKGGPPVKAKTLSDGKR